MFKWLRPVGQWFKNTGFRATKGTAKQVVIDLIEETTKEFVERQDLEVNVNAALAFRQILIDKIEKL